MSRKSKLTNIVLRGHAVAALNVGLLTGSNVVQLAVTLIVTILLGRSSGADDVGTLSLVMATGSIMQAVSVSGLVSVAVAALLEPGADRPRELRNVVYARAITVPAVFALGTALAFHLPGTEKINVWVLIAFFIGYGVGSFDIANISLTSRNRFHSIAVRRIILAILIAPATFYFANQAQLHLVLLLMAAQSALWQLILVPGAGLRLGLIKNCRSEFKSALVTVWNVRSLWAASIFGSVAQRIDLFILGAMMSVYAVGQYSSASRPIEATTMIAGSLVTVLFNPMASSFHDPHLYAQKVSISARIMLVISCTTSGVLVLFGPALIVWLYGSEFEPASELLPIYAIGIIFIFQKRLLDRIVVLEKGYAYNLSSSISTIILNVVLNVIFIEQWGLIGAAIASLLTHPFSLLASFGFTEKGRRMLMLAYGSAFMSRNKVYQVIAYRLNVNTFS